MSIPQPTVIPIYTTRGDAEAFLAYPYLFNRNGDWIGFATSNRDVYSVLGQFVGTISNDPRILRKRAMDHSLPRLTPPPAPGRITIPATVPLAPMMAELTHSMVDVLLDEPELLHTSDSGEQRQDMD